MNTRHNTRRKIFAAIGTLVTAGLLLGSGALAQADTDKSQPVPEQSSVVINKRTAPTTSNNATGEKIADDDVPGAAIEGVTFAAYLVPDTQKGGTNDIGTNAGQQYAAGLDLSAATGLIPAAATGEFPATGIDGITQMTLPRGLYVVKEKSAPAGVTPSAPFLLSVPLTNPTDLNKWLDPIYIYPKNSVVTVSKTADDAAARSVGDTSGTPRDGVSWTVQGDIPKDESITKYVIGDPLDSRLTLKGSLADSATVSLIGQDGTPLAGVTLTRDTDYTVTDNVTVTFTEAGRAKLVAAWKADAAAKVQLVIDTRVNATAAGAANTAAGTITNTATLTVNDATPVTDTASVKIGDIKIEKVSTASADTKLAGAAFQVFASAADAKSLTNPINVNGVTEWTTGENGQVTIPGLFFSNFVNGKDVADTTRTYWLAETKAPDGYQLMAEPIEAKVTAAGADVAVTQIANVPNTGGFVLPLTGGTGTILLTVVGLAILALVVFVARRRRAAEAAVEATSTK
ncbi:SpaH/EbpB family LPXTG-anchored major pilin [Pseudoclavibacter sp. 13-3]|uniref:SpaH/EbpB family LPXTG-anchored major pilin n=1 Tax=Pseudoclavibacter sp. 13-3 TaxID=2901228 RepID=UPI001E34F6E7|nr:SpaH/EbpB family LPXTG-anchored major pilin [Pseudoclavibacter sp. 13-3]MCD7101126.1 SpaH/EbpB family LPXTG-anchored major pilin [Pseudoclavibacter sp. 13-3]